MSPPSSTTGARAYVAVGWVSTERCTIVRSVVLAWAPMMKLSDPLAATVADELARCGVTDAVVSPGLHSGVLAHALYEQPEVRLHVRIDERSGAFLALGLARAGGRPAVA